MPRAFEFKNQTQGICFAERVAEKETKRSCSRCGLIFERAALRGDVDCVAQRSCRDQILSHSRGSLVADGICGLPGNLALSPATPLKLLQTCAMLLSRMPKSF